MTGKTILEFENEINLNFSLVFFVLPRLGIASRHV
jgi:hypothetical protein